MKTSLLLTFFFFLGIIKLHAQDLQDGLDLPAAKPRITAEQESQQLFRTLLLNEGQYLKVKEINKERHMMLDAVEAMYPHEPEKRDDKKAILELQFDQEFAAIFTPKQLKEYLELNGRGTNPPPKKARPVNEPTFNSQIQAVIIKALTPVVDSSQLAIQNTLISKSLETDSSSIFPMQLLDTTNANSSIAPDAFSSDSSQISLVVKDLETPQTVEKDTPLISDSYFEDWDQGDQQSKAKIKNDPNKGTLKVETPDGELKMQDGKEKAKDKSGLEYKSQSENKKLKIESPDRDTKSKDGQPIKNK